MAQIIDGLCDFDNVTADMIARHNMSMYGTSDYVLQIDECLEYDLVSNNEIHVKDGMYIMQGRRGCVKKGTTDICIIENGGQAVNRNDIIVIEYVKDEATRLESHTTKVIKGVPAEVAVDPELVTGDINAGAVLHQMPLYRVKIEGLNVVAVEQMFEIGSVAAETVNPMEATEPGFAADAYETKLQFDEQNKKLDKEWTYVTASNNQTLNIDLSKIEYIGVGGLINNELDNTTIIPVSVFKALGRTLQIFGYANGVLFTAGVAKVSDTSVKVSVSQFAGGACVIYK